MKNKEETSKKVDIEELQDFKDQASFFKSLNINN